MPASSVYLKTLPEVSRDVWFCSSGGPVSSGLYCSWVDVHVLQLSEEFVGNSSSVGVKITEEAKPGEKNPYFNICVVALHCLLYNLLVHMPCYHDI